MRRKDHLPLFGVGPVITGVQIIITAVGVILVRRGYWAFGQIACLNFPLKVTGILLIAVGILMNYCAKQRSRLFDMVEQNRLITTGIYSLVRNPVYSGVLIACTGVLCLMNNLMLFPFPILCWLWMTAMLMLTEEKWLTNLYGEPYIAYCKRVNRCIPRLPRSKKQ